MSLPAQMDPSLRVSAQDVAKLPESAWLQHRNVLHELYICQNKTLNEVKRTMEEVHGFPLMRAHDYEVALREVLGLRKNLTGQDWQAIKAHWDQRRDQGKKSNVLWNDMIVDEKKVLKAINRKRKRSHLFKFRSRLEAPALPFGVIIKTPPLSPTASIVTAVMPIESRPDSGPNVLAASNSLTWAGHGSPARSDSRITFLEPTQVGVSRFQELRKNCPFNVFFVKLQDFADSYRILDMVPIECEQAPRPRLMGINPSWELLARITFEISNNMSIDWTAHDSSWFLNWFGVSADLRVLRAFFSITGPTVCAVYENLCRTVNELWRPDAAKVLFEMLNTVRSNNPIVVDTLNFLEIAVRKGSTSDGMLRIATRAIEHHSQVMEDAAGHERLSLSSLIAASRCDIAMLRLLVDAGACLNFEAVFDVHSHYYREERILQFRTMYKLLHWMSDEDALHSFVRLLIKGGFLSTELQPYCHSNGGTKVSPFSRSIEFDHLIMLCPAKERQALYKIMINCTGDNQTIVRGAGIFTAAAGGVCSLKAYIQSCRQNSIFEFLFTMQESLLCATLLNDTETMSALLQIGTDPAVGLLQSNEERYDKGKLTWNPMVLAAMTGSKEALMLLKEWSNLDNFLAFLERVPIHEIVRQTNLNFRDVACRTDLCLWQLNDFRREILYDPDVNGEFESEITTKLIGSTTNRFEILTWIRSHAMAHNLAVKIDKDILKAALSKHLGYIHHIHRRYVELKQFHYCDVLLLDGLVDANFEYHESGMDLLQLSIRNNCSLEVVEFLLSRGFKVHSRPATETVAQNTLLHDALLSVSPDRYQIVRLLVHQGADCKQTTTVLPVLEASLLNFSDSRKDQGYLDIFQHLLDKGAPVPPRPRRLINLLVKAGAVDQLILSIIDSVGDVQKQGCSSQTKDFTWLPLTQVILQGRETLARELIRRGADVHAHAKSSRNCTALQAACKSESSLEFVKYLVVDNGADVNEAPAKNFGRTALQLCTSLHVAEFLLDRGANVNALSGILVAGEEHYDFRRRALDFAAEFGRLDLLEYLLQAGGRSGYGGMRGAFLLARIQGHFAVLSVLLEWEKKLGSYAVEEEAVRQQEHPGPVSKTACVPLH